MPDEFPFFPTIWNVFHDGSIDRVEGAVPGSVSVYVDIDYLRERFSDPGEHFIVTFPNCLDFSFQLYDDSTLIVDFAAIADAWPGILSAEMDGEDCKVFTDSGILRMKASSGSIRLDSGREISLCELLDTAASYWEEWEAAAIESKTN